MLKKRVTAIFLAGMVGVTSVFTNNVTVSADSKQEQIRTGDLAAVVDSNVKGAEYGDYEYKVLEDNTIGITKYNGTKENVSIPSQIDGKDVTSIEEYAFYGCSSLVEINIPKSVINIGNAAFYDCSALMEITIPENVTSIGDGAFYNCGSLVEITIPGSVTSIGQESFYGCWKLSSITLSKGLSTIGAGAFAYCDGLKEIAIPEGVINIGMGAFQRCSELSTITLPKSLTIITDNVFERCGSLKDVYYAGNESQWAEIERGNGNEILDTAAIHYNEDKEKFEYQVLENGTLEITMYSGTEENVSIPPQIDGIAVTSIGDFAFSECSSLNSIEIPESVTSIGNGAFFDCSEDLILTVIAGSYAETYAKDHNIKYRSIGECIHNYKSQITTEPTCTEAGVMTYTCTKCGNSYTEKIPSTGHTWKTTVTPATTKKNGSMVEKCSKCGKQKRKTVFYAAKTVKLSKTTYTYNGKVRKPSVTIKDSKGKKLKNKVDYTISYSKGMKNVGKYTVTIKFKGNYSGKVKKTFTITPKKTSISKVTSKPKGFTVKWKKQASQTTGYEIAYSTSSKFTKKATKIITVGKNKTTSASVSKLKAKKKYYVRIRTYKTVKGKKYHSGWSKVKKVTTKDSAAKDIPGLNAQITVDNILKILDRYDKDGAYILRTRMNAGDDILVWFSYSSRIIDGIDTAVHEETHGYSHQGWNETAYFVGNGNTIHVPHTTVYLSKEMADSIPENLRTSRYNTYVAQPSEYLSSNVQGAYGLMNEFMAYRMGMSTTVSLYQYYVDKEADWDAWRKFINSCENNRLAYTEFKYYILHYLSYARQYYPQVYTEIVNNKEFCKAYRQLESSFAALIGTYEKDLKKIQKLLKEEGYNVDIEDDTIWFDKGNGSRTGVVRFTSDYKKLQKELNKTTYKSIHDQLTANGI